MKNRLHPKPRAALATRIDTLLGLALPGRALWTAVALGVAALPARANPNDGRVTAGDVGIQRDGAVLTIEQKSQRAIVEWSDFSIAKGEHTRFLQSGRDAAILNRVSGKEASRIDGRLTGDGQVYLLNPNGIVVGPSGVIDTYSFIGSTLDLPDDAFLAGGTLEFRGDSAAQVVNLGIITARGGDVILMAHEVSNDGTIEAPEGTVGLAAGSEVLLYEKGEERIAVRAGTGSVANAGTITATAAELKAAGGNLYALAINQTGIIRATTVERHGGRVLLKANRGVVQQAGQIEARGEVSKTRGGQVRVAGEKIVLTAGSVIDASGAAGGGTVEVGGGLSGKNPEIPNATAVAMAPSARIHADATEAGDGGSVVLWSEEYTNFHGIITARGGPLGGDGGFIETSSRLNLQAFGSADASAPAGRPGRWLLDPRDVTIAAGGGSGGTFDGGNPDTFTPTNNNATIDVATINASLNAGTSVTVNTGTTGAQEGNITLAANTAVTKTAGGDATLRLEAANSIFLLSGSSITSSSGRLNVVLNADADASGAGAIALTSATITTNGGNIVMGGSADPLTGSAFGTASNPSGILLFGSLLSSGAGFVALRGTGFGSGSNPTPGIDLRNATSVTSTSGSISLLGFGGASGNAATGVFFGSGGATVSTSSGAITLTGTGGSGTAQYSVGVRLDTDNAIVEATGTGTISITGTGGANSQWGHGVLIGSGSNSRVTTASGSLSISGTAIGSNETYGVVSAWGGTIETGSGALTITGVAPAGSAGALATQSVNPLRTTAGGNITLNADTLDLQGTLSGSGALVIQPTTSGATIGLGNSASGALNLDATELANLSNGFSSITIGRADGSGAVDVRTAAFNDPVTIRTPAGSGMITLNGALSTGSGTSSGSITLTAAGALSGAAGSSITTQNQAINLTGAPVSGAMAIASNGGLVTINQTGSGTVSGLISGSGGLTKTGPGTLTLSNSNTYSGATTVNAGTVALSGFLSSTTSLVIAAGANLNLVGTGAWNRLNFSGTSWTIAGTLDNQQTGTTVAQTLPASVTLNGGTITATGGATSDIWGHFAVSQGPVITVTGTSTMNGSFRGGTAITLSPTISSDTLQFTGALGNNGTLSLVKSGSGTAVLSGANAHTGTTTVNAGTLIAGSTSAFGSLSAVTVASGATLDLAANSNTIGSLAGAGTVTNSGATAATLTTGGDNTSTTFSGAIQNGAGTLALTKAGSGTFTLDGANTYTGATAVNAGVLSIGGSGTLGGGNYAGAFSVAGTLSYDSSTSQTWAGNTTGAGAIVKNGSGTLTLSGRLQHTGATTLNAGTLALYGPPGVTGGAYNFGGTLNINNGSAVTVQAVYSGAQYWFQGATVVFGPTGGGSIGQISTNWVTFGTTFRTTGGAQNTITSSMNVSGSTVTFDIAPGSFPVALAATDVSNTGTLTKTGAGTLQLTGNNTLSTFNISAGTLQVGAGGTSGTLGTAAVTNNGALVFNRSGALTVSGAISGTGTVTQAGSGTTTLSNTNTYTGATTVSAGTLRAGSSTAFGTLSATSVASGAVLDLSGFSNTIGSLAGAGTVTNSGASGATLTAGGNNTSTTFSGVIQNGTGPTAFTKAGTGTLTLTGTNTYQGTTTVNAGTLQIGNGGTTGTSGTGAVTNNGSLVFNRSNIVTVANDIAGTGSVTQTGSGVLTFTGANTYSGTTNVSAGTLTLSGAWNRSGATASVAVAAGATLNGTGVVTASTLNVAGLGTVSLTGNNVVNTLAGSGTIGVLTFFNDAPLAVNGLTASGAIALQTAPTFDVTLNQAISSSAAGDAIVIASGDDFLNNAGAAAMTTASGRFLVYSSDWAEDVTGGLSAGRLYNRTFAANPPGTITPPGSQFIYSRQPTLTLTALDASRDYGDANPSFGVLISGLVNGDSPAGAYSGSPTATTLATQTSGIGTYAITPGIGTMTLSGQGYAVSYVPGTLTIDRALLTVSVDDKVRVYGEANPTLTAVVTGFKNGEGASVISGLSLSTLATQSSGIGRYAITAGGASAANYAFAYNDGTLTIGRALLTVTADNKSRAYGDANPALTATITGFKNGENASVVSGLSLSPLATQSSGIGTYAITAGGASAANYAFAYNDGALTIDRALLVIRADDKTRLVGRANRTFTATFSGFKNGEDPSVVSGLVFNTAATTASRPGAYSITPSGASAANYAITFEDGTLLVLAAPVPPQPPVPPGLDGDDGAKDRLERLTPLPRSLATFNAALQDLPHRRAMLRLGGPVSTPPGDVRSSRWIVPPGAEYSFRDTPGGRFFTRGAFGHGAGVLAAASSFDPSPTEPGPTGDER